MRCILGFPRREGDRGLRRAGFGGMTVFAHFPMDTKYFGDGDQRVMVNFRVDDMDACWRSWKQRE